jgi:hypothetical protein
MLLSQLTQLAIITRPNPSRSVATDPSTNTKLFETEVEYGALAGV